MKPAALCYASANREVRSPARAIFLNEPWIDQPRMLRRSAVSIIVNFKATFAVRGPFGSLIGRFELLNAGVLCMYLSIKERLVDC